MMSVGLPCTSFVWINSPTHQRSAESPLGDTSLKYVRDANTSFGCIAALIVKYMDAGNNFADSSTEDHDSHGAASIASDDQRNLLAG